MKAGNIRDRLNVIVTGKVGVGSAVEIIVVSGNGINILQSKRLRKGSAGVRIGCAAITNVPARVDVELHQVREAQLTRGPCSCASRQSFELAQVDRLGSSGHEIGVEEGGVADFIQRVTADILRAITIEVR